MINTASDFANTQVIMIDIATWASNLLFTTTTHYSKKKTRVQKLYRALFFYYYYVPLNSPLPCKS